MNINEYLVQLETLVNIDCGSHNSKGIHEVAQHLKRWYKEIGWHIKETAVENGPVLEISNHPNCSHYDAMFIGHMDTVFQNGTVKKRPFKKEGNKCFGPGVEDMKNGDLAMLHIAKEMGKEELDKLNICMCYNPDEEISSRYSRNIIKAIARKSDRVFVMESAQNNGAGHVFNRKGKTNYVLKFSGIEAHAGYMFEVENASAIEEMGHYIVELQNLKDEEKETSVNVGVVNGGTTVNTVAGIARLEAEIRYHTMEERNRVVNHINHLIEKGPFVPKVKVEIEYFDETPPWVQTAEGWEYINKVKEIADNLGIAFEERKRGGLSDANHLSTECAIILDGMGPFGQFAHSEREYMTIDSVEQCVRLFVEVLRNLRSCEKTD